MERISESARANKTTGIYTDTNGDKWAPLNQFRKDFGLQHGLIKSHITEIRFLSGRAGNGRPTNLYHVGDVTSRFSDYITLPIPEEGQRTNYVPTSILMEESGISNRKTLLRYLSEVPKMRGKAGNGHITMLYQENQAKEQLAKFLSLPQVSTGSNIYSDQESKEWIPLRVLNRESHLSYSALSRLLEDVSAIDGRDHSGKVTKLFPRTEALQKIAPFTQLPLADKKTGRFTDDKGDQWLPQERFYREFGIDLHLDQFKEVTEQIKTIQCRDANGHKRTFYKEAEVMSAFVAFIATPRAKRGNGQYLDEQGISWITPKRLQKLTQASAEIIVAVLDRVLTIKVRDGSGKILLMFNEEEAKKEIALHLSSSTKADISAKQEKEVEHEWVTINYLVGTLGFSERTLLRRLSEVPTKQGSGENGHECTLYQKAAVLATLGDYLSSPQVDGESGNFTDKAGNIWLDIRFLRKQSGLAHKTLYKILEGVPTLNGKSARNQQIILYDQKLAMERLANISKTPKVDAESGLFTNDGGDWANLEYLLTLFPVGKKAVKNVLKSSQISFILGRCKNGFQTQLYNLKEAQAVLGTFKDRKQVDFEVNTYTDEQGESWTTARFIRDKYGISTTMVATVVARLTSMPGRDKCNRCVILYNLRQVEQILASIQETKKSSSEAGDPLLQEYTNLLRSGQIMSLEEFVTMREREHG